EEPDPVVLQHAVVEQFDHPLHKIAGSGRVLGQFAGFVADFCDTRDDDHAGILTHAGESASEELGTLVIRRIPFVLGKSSGWIACASASRPLSRDGAGVLRSSSLMQNTR